MTPIPASQQVTQLVQQLNSLLIKKHTLDAELKSTDDGITAIRNVIQGIEIGKALQQEVNSTAAAQVPAEANK
jgi:hypothetical protein